MKRANLFLLSALLTAFFVAPSTRLNFVCADESGERPDPFAPSSVEYADWAPTLVDDAVMPTSLRRRALSNWIDAAFAGQKFAPVADGFSIEVVRQDFNGLHCDESCLGTPLCVGKTNYRNGLGTHSNGEIVFRFEKPVAKFSALAGIDSNRTTNGTAGSVVFSVLADGKEVAKSPVVRGQDAPFAFDVEFSSPVSSLTLKVDGTDDGPNYDQADWLEPVATSADGTRFRLNEFADVPLATKIPFSFEYDEKTSAELLPTWTFEYQKIDARRSNASWLDPKTGLKVVAEIDRKERFAALDWVVTFENTSAKETPILENVRAADVDFDDCVDVADVVLRTLDGDYCNEKSWLPLSFAMKTGESKEFAPIGGRSSNGAFPFWNLQQNGDVDDSTPSQGVFFAVGWSGQWSAKFERKTPNVSTFSAGQETLSTVLFPGEKIRTPRILVAPWKTDFASAQARFRRLLLFEYAPKRPDGTPQNLLAVGQCFDRYYRKRPGWEKIAGQLEYAQKLKDAGCDAHWFDAAWFPKGFPNGVGSWFSDSESFPNGVEELGKALREREMDFVLWFEPERVAKDTEFSNDYPQYVFGGKEGGLFKLNDPEARRFLIDLLAKRIEEFNVDVFRTDFNIDPLPFWTANDASNRRGVTENRYVEGLYEYWDELRAKFPGLWIDDCASGGRRIDLETISRSIPLWRSDTCCWPGHPEWDQTQTLGLATYLPLYSCCAWDPSPYTFRSAANPGVLVQFDFFNENYETELAADVRAAISEGKVYRKFWGGDFYPLTDPVVGQKAISAWQLHRADLDAGLVYVFRQTNSPYTGCEFSLRGIDPNATYRVRYKYGYAVDEEKTTSGKELIALPASLKEKKTALVVEYEKIDR